MSATGGESASVRLRQVEAELGRTQKALAASQADLTRVERLLQAVVAERAAGIRQLAEARSEIDQLRAERNAAWELAGHTPDREEPTRG